MQGTVCSRGSTANSFVTVTQKTYPSLPSDSHKLTFNKPHTHHCLLVYTERTQIIVTQMFLEKLCLELEADLEDF